MTYKTLPDTIRVPITTFVSAKVFIEALHKEGLMYHFDDGAVDCLHETNELVSLDDAKLIDAQVDRLYGFEWGEHDCPIGYALFLENPNWNKDNG